MTMEMFTQKNHPFQTMAFSLIKWMINEKWMITNVYPVKSSIYKPTSDFLATPNVSDGDDVPRRSPAISPLLCATNPALQLSQAVLALSAA